MRTNSFWSASSSKSRRTVIVETPRLSPISLTVTIPLRSTKLRIVSKRSSFNISSPRTCVHCCLILFLITLFKLPPSSIFVKPINAMSIKISFALMIKDRDHKKTVYNEQTDIMQHLTKQKTTYTHRNLLSRTFSQKCSCSVTCVGWLFSWCR
ncbi:hypothetical protein LPIBR_60100 [Lacticaseibacillus paracasei]|nr:hypothetical protein LPIBR_60100 [Lacticaseibacillus paracasei]